MYFFCASVRMQFIVLQGRVFLEQRPSIHEWYNFCAKCFVEKYDRKQKEISSLTKKPKTKTICLDSHVKKVASFAGAAG